MRGEEFLTTLNKQRTDAHRFVKWWRKENDFLDYDLIDRFVNTARLGEDIGGMELLTMDEMWDQVKRVGGTRVKLVHEIRGDRVEWVHMGKRGTETEVCAFTPETIMHIFDVETRGNPVDS